MSNIIELDNSNEMVNWFDESITNNYLKYYEYSHFYNVQEIGFGRFGKIYRANCRNSCIVLKSFFNFNNVTVKEIVNEVIAIKYMLLSLRYYFIINLTLSFIL
jgi:hypothetical protein